MSPASALIGVPEFSVSELVNRKCCNRSEVTCFKKLSQADIEGVRQEFFRLPSETVQNQFVIDYFRRNSDCSGSANSILYSVAGKAVCDHCWRLVYGLKSTRF